MSQKKQDEVDKLLQQLASLPKATTDDTPMPETKKNTNWKRKSGAIARGGRVNRTKGK